MARKYGESPTLAAPLLTVLALALVALTPTARAEAAPEAEVTYSGSLHFSSGDYTLSETTSTFLFINSFSFSKGKITASASLPVIHQDSPFVTYVGGLPVPSGRRQGTTSEDPGGSGSSGQGSGVSSSGRGSGGTIVVPDPQTLDFEETGVGDPLLRLDISLLNRTAQGLRMGVYGATKAPIADEEDGFGTGEWDFGAGLTATKKVGSVLLLADLGYWTYGDLPDLELDDPVVYSLGVGRVLAGGRTSWLASLAGSTGVVAGTDGPLEGTLTLSRRAKEGRTFNLTLAGGLSESSPDYSLAAGWRLNL